MPCAVLPRLRFFPQIRGFSLVLGNSVRDWGILALALEFPGCAGGVAFSLRLPVLRLGHCLRWLALRLFAASLPLIVPTWSGVFLCGCIVVRWSCLPSLLLLCAG